MESDHRIAVVWIALALLASLTAFRLKQSIAPIEILVGVAAREPAAAAPNLNGPPVAIQRPREPGGGA